MKTENLVEKALAKATGRSLNDILSGLSGSMTLEQAKEAIQWAIDERTNDILGTLREIKVGQEDYYGVYQAIEIVNDKFFE